MCNTKLTDWIASRKDAEIGIGLKKSDPDYIIKEIEYS
jgi:hypothetical protein